MSDSKSVAIGGGFPLASILTIIFVIAKLTGYITWSWLWVLAPIWIGFAIAAGIMALVLIVGLVVAILAAMFD